MIQRLFLRALDVKGNLSFQGSQVLDVYITWKIKENPSDEQDRAVGNVEAVRRVAQARDLGARIWESWAMSVGGSKVEMQPTSGTITVPASKLADLPKVIEQYSGAVGADVSVGIGMNLNEAELASQAAQKSGQEIRLYDDEVRKELAPESKEENLFEGLGKAEGSAPDEQTDGESLAPEQPTPTEEDFQQLASQPEGQADDQSELKDRLVRVLQQLQGQGPVLEQIRQKSPETYQAIMGLTQGVIEMARELSGGNEVQKSEDPLEEEFPEVKEKVLKSLKRHLKTYLFKARTTPVFPKLGVPDNRRETPIVDTPRQIDLKTKLMANKVIGESPRAEALPPKLHNWYRNHVAQNLQHQTMGAVTEGRGGQLSFALGPNFRRMLNPETGGDYRSSLGTKHHEDWHMIMGRIAEKHGQRARSNLPANLLNQLKNRDPEAHAVMRTLGAIKNKLHPSDPLKNEEDIAAMMNFTNDPHTRRNIFNQIAQVTGRAVHPLDQRAFGNYIKRAYNHINSMSRKEVDPKWLLDPRMFERQRKQRVYRLKLAASRKARDERRARSAEAAALGKASLSPTAGLPKRKHLHLPLGSKIDPAPNGRFHSGRIKVQHGDGSQSWIQARSGEVLSNDGHAISAKNPNGR